MKNIFRKNLAFLIPYLIFLILAVFFLIAYDKRTIHIFLNGLNNDFGDFLFKWATFLGDGLFVGFLAIIFLFIRYRYGLGIAITALATGIIIQVLKQFIFPGIARPVEFFGDSFTLQLVHGVKLYKWHSFPSGHTASAFALFFTLAVFSSKGWIKFLCFIPAVLVGYSRIYLSQHFLIDVTAGSFIAVIVVICYFTIMKEKNFAWMDASLVRRKKSYDE